ncbi:MAG: hypothetical protein HY077_08545 [Elusimicrobia bacterium]|nr:hypothetical protein [Elusimicrobiota bacterium]
MLRSLLAACLLAAPVAAKDPPLVGVWTLDGAPYAELRANGTGSVRDEPVQWKADSKALALSYANGASEIMLYKVVGNKLTIVMNGQSQVLTKASVKKAVKGKVGKDQLSALLMSSPWCSFTYNQISGASHQERVVFRPGGVWGSGSRGESYSSGAYGSVAGQSDAEGGGRWQASGGRLLMSQGGGALEDTGLSVTRNSNGYPILKTGKKEYSQCR